MSLAKSPSIRVQSSTALSSKTSQPQRSTTIPSFQAQNPLKAKLPSQKNNWVHFLQQTAKATPSITTRLKKRISISSQKKTTTNLQSSPQTHILLECTCAQALITISLMTEQALKTSISQLLQLTPAQRARSLPSQCPLQLTSSRQTCSTRNMTEQTSSTAPLAHTTR